MILFLESMTPVAIAEAIAATFDRIDKRRMPEQLRSDASVLACECIKQLAGSTDREPAHRFRRMVFVFFYECDKLPIGTVNGWRIDSAINLQYADRDAMYHAFRERLPVTVPDAGRPGHYATGIIQSVEHEDGSGHSFNLSIAGNWYYWKATR